MNLEQNEAALTPASLAQLKARIVEISRSNMTRTDNFEEVEAELRPLVSELVRRSPSQSEAQKQRAVAGAWHQLWSNLQNPTPGFIKQDLSEIYQVVSPNNYYYNFGTNRLIGFVPTTTVLRGKYRATPAGFEVEFTRLGFRIGAINERRDLVAYMDRFENGGKRLLTTGSGRAPNGPIGIQGHLTTIYVDSELRIAGGDQTPFTDDKGTVLVPGKQNLLFVLERHHPSSAPADDLYGDDTAE